ncbi:MAG TPA: Mov34/MPN/PAD-1 family protein [Puia sp.]|uniref:Mov34/MPN/PAD-1 family protein n=1 Tax=Puia sp. TaxID=2045100 RepID=UPI002C92C6D3|nr:Mov34/MPN/PAD-1 family protein [Puia sp.]HVU96902.1 Mov34/MPN/PAD-1 family protein [Puia sp.]
MAAGKYSDRLTKYGQEIANPDLIHSLNNLKEFLGMMELDLLEWGCNVVAIPLTVKVNLPSLGTFQDIDIRAEEPILMVLFPRLYPMTGPRIYPDRLDFPRKTLGHLYVPQGERPPAFCLVREDFDEWYAGKQMKDVVIRTANWLQDAATGDLVADGGQFEPLRLENYSGKMTYDYSELADIIVAKTPILEGHGFSMALFEHVSIEDGHHFRFLEVLHDNVTASSVAQKIQVEEQKDSKDPTRRTLRLGFLLWARDDAAYKHYDIDLPRTWGAFRTYFEQYGVDVRQFEGRIEWFNSLLSLEQTPFVVAIKRPAPLIGFLTDLELMNFHMEWKQGDVTKDGIKDDTPMAFKKHEQPLTAVKAREISGSMANLTNQSLMVGLGAVGMRIALHLAKSGDMKFTYADGDSLAPHNFTRLPLSPLHTGKQKTSALLQELYFLYRQGDSLKAGATEMDVIRRQDMEKQPYEWILDFTASSRFMNELVQASVAVSPRIARGLISDFGNLGILMFEGKERNPRVDDLQVALFVAGRTNRDISAWLHREASSTPKATSFATGLGCSCETTILANDRIDIHGGLLSGLLKAETHFLQGEEGKIFLNQLADTPFFQSKSDQLIVKPLDVVECVNDKQWQVRYASGILQKMKDQMKKAFPRETGGVLLGVANHKTRVIHVAGLIDAPPDSRSNLVCFLRGKEGLPESIDEVVARTGGQIGYIGEWHSHPCGPEAMSPTDETAVARFKAEYKDLTTPLPVFLTIVTPKSVLPFIY